MNNSQQRIPVRKLFITIFSIVTLAIIFLLFKPIFVWVYNWKPLPSGQHLPIDEKIYNTHYSEEIVTAKSALYKAREELDAPAFSAAVGINGELVWAATLGYANLDDLSPATTESSFRIGSTSKAVTSMGVAKLLQDNKLDIDKNIDEYVDYFPQKKHTITTRQLLSHMAGIRNYQMCFCFPAWEYYNQTHYSTIEQAVGIFSKSPLQYKPGTKFRYTSYGYTLVSAVIEGISKKNFLNFMQETVLTPLDMQNTMPDFAQQNVSNRVNFYNIEDGQYKEAFFVDNSNKWAGGGFISTSTDLVKMGNALLNEQYVDAKTVKRLLTPQKLNNGEINPDAYALGWRSHASESILLDGRKIHVAHHGGVANGSLSFLLLLPGEKIVVSILANRDWKGQFPMHKFAYAIARPFVERHRPR